MQKGFTLVEILVVVAITALISGIVISYSKVGENQVGLYVETQKIASAILRAKSLAIATFDLRQCSDGADNDGDSLIDFPSDPGCAGQNDPTERTEILCGYGFDIDYKNRTYRVFSYEPAATTCSGINLIQNSSKVALFNSVYVLPQGIAWDATPPDNLRALLFVPPAPLTLISTNPGGSVASIPGKIYLSTADGTAQTVITVDLAGQVDF